MGEGKKMLLDKDKKTRSKAKEKVCGFWIASVVDRVGSRACRNQ